MKIWVISDTHGSHFLLDTPTDVDMVIHCGDCTDNFNYYTNKEEFFSFFICLRIPTSTNTSLIALLRSKSLGLFE